MQFAGTVTTQALRECLFAVIRQEGGQGKLPHAHVVTRAASADAVFLVMCACRRCCSCLYVSLWRARSHCLFGRNWGCAAGKEFKNLHFELCYYQAIEEAIQRKLPRVEAGAQGEHKLQRGLLPNFTYSAHYMPDPIMQGAVQKFLDRENAQVC